MKGEAVEPVKIRWSNKPDLTPDELHDHQQSALSLLELVNDEIFDKSRNFPLLTDKEKGALISFYTSMKIIEQDVNLVTIENLPLLSLTYMIFNLLNAKRSGFIDDSEKESEILHQSFGKKIFSDIGNIALSWPEKLTNLEEKVPKTITETSETNLSLKKSELLKICFSSLCNSIDFGTMPSDLNKNQITEFFGLLPSVGLFSYLFQHVSENAREQLISRYKIEDLLPAVFFETMCRVAILRMHSQEENGIEITSPPFKSVKELDTVMNSDHSSIAFFQNVYNVNDLNVVNGVLSNIVFSTEFPEDAELMMDFIEREFHYKYSVLGIKPNFGITYDWLIAGKNKEKITKIQKKLLEQEKKSVLEFREDYWWTHEMYKKNSDYYREWKKMRRNLISIDDRIPSRIKYLRNLKKKIMTYNAGNDTSFKDLLTRNDLLDRDKITLEKSFRDLFGLRLYVREDHIDEIALTILDSSQYMTEGDLQPLLILAFGGEGLSIGHKTKLFTNKNVKWKKKDGTDADSNTSPRFLSYGMLKVPLFDAYTKEAIEKYSKSVQKSIAVINGETIKRYYDVPYKGIIDEYLAKIFPSIQWYSMKKNRSIYKGIRFYLSMDDGTIVELSIEDYRDISYHFQARDFHENAKYTKPKKE